MKLGETFEQFLQHAPISVMYRALLEHAIDPSQIDELFERAGRQDGLEVMRGVSACQLAKALTLLAKASDEIHFRKPCKLTEGLDAPLREGCGVLFTEVQHAERKRREDRSFSAGWGMGEGGVAGAGKTQGGVDVDA